MTLTTERKEVKDHIVLELAFPTVFPKYNSAKGFAPDHITDKLTVQRMKHKHFRKLQTMREEQQLHYLMGELTGLSQDDIDELDAERLSCFVGDFVRLHEKYAEISHKILSSVPTEK